MVMQRGPPRARDSSLSSRVTTEELARRGWRVVAEEEVIAGRQELLGQGPTVVTLLDNELSRARGGPRCMTMPLERDPL